MGLGRDAFVFASGINKPELSGKSSQCYVLARECCVADDLSNPIKLIMTSTWKTMK